MTSHAPLSSWLELGRHEVLVNETDRIVGKVAGVARNADEHPILAYVDVMRGDNMKLIGEYLTMSAAKAAVEEALKADRETREAHGGGIRLGIEYNNVLRPENPKPTLT